MQLLSRRKIALVAFHYHPDDAVGSIRPQNWARWLACDHDVTVITRPAKGEPEEKVDTIRILRPASAGIAFVEWLNDKRKARRVARAGSQTITAAAGDMPARVPSGIFRYRMPCAYDLWLPAILRGLVRAKPDIVIATHSPYVGLVGAALYKVFNPKVDLWLDLRDLWTRNLYTRGAPVFRTIEQVVERWALGKADIVTTVSKGLAEELSCQAPEASVAVVHNAAEVGGPLNDTGSKSISAGSKITFCYTGTIYPGFRDPSPLFDLLRKLIDLGRLSPDAVSLVVASRDPGDLMVIADRYHLKRIVDYRGQLSRQDAIALQNEADVLLLLETGNESVKGVLTGKVFEYLETDKPVMLLGPRPGSELYDLLARHRRLVSLVEIEALLTGARGTLGPYERVDTVSMARRELQEALGRL